MFIIPVDLVTHIAPTSPPSHLTHTHTHTLAGPHKVTVWNIATQKPPEEENETTSLSRTSGSLSNHTILSHGLVSNISHPQ